MKKPRFLLSLATALVAFSQNTSAQTSLTVPATSDWIATGVFRGNGEKVVFCATGLASAWNTPGLDCWQWLTPSGLGRIGSTSTSNPCEDCPGMALIAKIGVNGVPFYVGDRGVIRDFDAPTGEVYVRVNDATPADNQGAFQVTISKQCSEIEACYEGQTGLTSSIDEAEKPVPTPEWLKIQPNPTSGEISVQVEMAEPGNVDVAIYDVNGQLLTTLAQGKFGAGSHVLRCDLRRFHAAPFVVVQVLAGSQSRTEKVVVMP